ncbi:MAG: hypothetical protein VX777_09490 [Chlamydiota bacterium]|nr:hypothetical protein [Chlamydiota bacterium]
MSSPLERQIYLPEQTYEKYDHSKTLEQFNNHGVLKCHILKVISINNSIEESSDPKAICVSCCVGTTALVVACVASAAIASLTVLICAVPWVWMSGPAQGMLGVFGGLGVGVCGLSLALVPCLIVPAAYVNSYEGTKQIEGEHKYEKIEHQLTSYGQKVASPKVCNDITIYQNYAFRHVINNMSLWQLCIYEKQNNLRKTSAQVDDINLVETIRAFSKYDNSDLQQKYIAIATNPRRYEIEAGLFVCMPPEKIAAIHHLFTNTFEKSSTQTEIHLKEVKQNASKTSLKVTITNLTKLINDSESIKRTFQQEPTGNTLSLSDKKILLLPNASVFLAYLNFFDESFDKLKKAKTVDLIQLNNYIQSKMLYEYIDHRLFQRFMNNKIDLKELKKLGNAMQNGDCTVFGSILNYPLTKKYTLEYLQQKVAETSIIALDHYLLLKELEHALPREVLCQQFKDKFDSLALEKTCSQKILEQVFQKESLLDEKKLILDTFKESTSSFDILSYIKFAETIQCNELLDACYQKIENNQFKNTHQFREIWKLAERDTESKIYHACLECAKVNKDIITTNWPIITEQPDILRTILNSPTAV